MTGSRALLVISLNLCFAFLATTADAQTRCVVADPSGTPLNVRSQPQGTILGALSNGTAVEVRDVEPDRRGNVWARVVPPGRGKAGWVYRDHLKCDQPVEAGGSRAAPRRVPSQANELQCVPKSVTARILQSPSPNDVHPHWRGETRIGRSWTFALESSVKTEAGLYFVGKLISPSGGVQQPIFVLGDEWDCE